MAVALESASKSPILSSAFKSLFFALAVFWFRAGGFDFLAIIAFSSLFAIFYFRPALGSVKLLAGASTIVLLAIKLPYSPAYEIYFSVFLGVLLYLLLGVKNLLHLRRKDFYYLLHFGEVIALGALSIKGVIHPLLAFLVFFFLFREFYVFFLNGHPRKIWLAGGVHALILSEALWIISLLPLGSLLGGSLTAILVFIFHDLTLHHFEGLLSRELILRNATALIFFTFLILGISKWTLS